MAADLSIFFSPPPVPLGNTYQVARVSSTREAFVHIEQQISHLILLDVKLPDQDRCQICQPLRYHHDYCLIPIIMMAGYAEIDSAVAGFRAGAGDYLSKPFRLEELRARAEAVLGRIGSATSAHPS